MTRRPSGEAGSMAVEIVILVPVLLLLLSLIVAMGRFVTTQGDVQAAARESVRAATLARDVASARVAAQEAATASLPADADCRNVELSGDFTAGSTLTVTLRCDVSWKNLSELGLGASTTITEKSSAPLDRFRRTSPGGSP
ncbi:MAG: TadE/TadG family type IV pilus assembly protein [Brevundimonas sp.]